jgi:L-lysine 2,3-aminomutase
MGYLHGYRTPGGQRRFPVQELDEFVSSLEERTSGSGSGRFVRESEEEAGTPSDAPVAPDVP